MARRPLSGQAHAITNLLGQCRATLEHRGPIIIDYTSPNMRLVTPEIAKFEFPDIQLQPPEAIPPRPEGLPPFEELPPWEPDPFLHLPALSIPVLAIVPASQQIDQTKVVVVTSNATAKTVKMVKTETQ